MKRLLGLALGMLAAACLWTGCAERPVADWQRGFFIPMDGYCAMGENETLTLALTYYIDAAVGGDMGEDVTAIALDGIGPDQLKVEMDEIAPMEPMNGHHGYSVTLQIAPAAQGDGRCWRRLQGGHLGGSHGVLQCCGLCLRL